MKGLKLAVLGLARSGASVAKTAQSLGAQVEVFDQRSAESLGALAEEMSALGIAVHAEHTGSISGFDQLVTSPGVDMRSQVLREAEQAGTDVISEVEFAYRIAKAPIIAITGSNGKSTSTVMTYLSLLGAGAKPILCGNIHGSGYAEMPLTAAAAEATADQVLVAEISSFQLEWVRDFRPLCAGITNITPDHLNRYDSFEQYATTKRRIFDRMGEGDTIVANAGDTATYPSNPALRDRGFGLPLVRFYGAAGLDASFDSTHIKLGIIQPIHQMPFSERHNLMNACHASLLAMSYLESVNLGSAASRTSGILEGLQTFKGLAHRMERLGHRDGIEIINNSMCTNPAAVVASSASLSMPQHLLIGGIKKNYDFGPVREHLERTHHDVYLFGRDREEISQELGGNCNTFGTMEEAFVAATQKASAGDVIMLAPGCASMDQFLDFVDRGEAFREMAKEWLNHGTTN